MNVKRFYTISGVTIAILMLLALLSLSRNYRLDDIRQTLQKEYSVLLNGNDQFRVHLSMESTLSEVYTTAIEKLDMVFPERIIYIHARH